MVHEREGCRQRIGRRPIPTRMIAASVTVTENVWRFVMELGSLLHVAYFHASWIMALNWCIPFAHVSVSSKDRASDLFFEATESGQ